MQARDFPLQIAVTLQRSRNIHFVLLHVAGNFQLRHRHLPAAAVQAALGLDHAVELRRPVRHLFGGVDPIEGQLAAPADRLLPVEERLQLGFPFQGVDRQLVEINLPLIAFGVEGDFRRRQRLTFHRRGEGQRVVGHFTAELQLDIIGLELLLAAEWPGELLTLQLHIERQPGLRQLRIRAQRGRDWPA